MKRIAALILTCGALAACTTPTVYAPAASPTASGFSEMRIEADRYRVTYRGGSGAPAAQVADYALLRAAELTVASSYDWFRVVGRYQEGYGGGRGPQLSVGGGSTSFGRRSAVGLGVGTSFDLSGGPQLATTLEIKMGKGARPDDRDVYDASDVIRTIGPRAPQQPPPPPPPR
jgi:hypothetical protein